MSNYISDYQLELTEKSMFNALSGSKDAQKFCTDKKIMLPCPKCHSVVATQWNKASNTFSFRCECGLIFNTDKDNLTDALGEWNSRSVPHLVRGVTKKLLSVYRERDELAKEIAIIEELYHRNDFIALSIIFHQLKNVIERFGPCCVPDWVLDSENAPKALEEIATAELNRKESLEQEE